MKNEETLEEAYLNELIDEANKEFTLDKKLAKEVAIKFSKWQQERSYSEEDFKLFARQFYREIKLDKSNLLWDELADKCFEQFKKKQEKVICPLCKGEEYSITKSGFKCAYTDCQKEW
jgi:hypothetical protein